GGYSTNVLVHAFAGTARATGFGPALVDPFFASMRMDLERTVHDDASLATYVHGSAEVVGLMCLHVFLHDLPEEVRRRQLAALSPGARALGAAFQKVNFLRDIGDDAVRLGRSYFPGVDPWRLTEAEKHAILTDIDADMSLAAAAIPALPAGSARAVRIAHLLFGELLERLRAAPAEDLVHHRVRVPAAAKARLAGTALLRGGRA
ncbi:squalene/phytoene synthase family protein, partial [Georgenia sp. 10Sc9-8]|nr:squalene/phytoene synthase family protein [Georgenia halotolerans]